MSQQCVNSFMDSLEDLIEDSEFSAPNFTVDEESFKRLQQFANHAIHGKYSLLIMQYMVRDSVPNISEYCSRYSVKRFKAETLPWNKVDKENNHMN